MTMAVIMFKDIRGDLWETVEESHASDAGYALDEQIRMEKGKITAYVFKDTHIRGHEIEAIVDSIFKKYDITERK